MRAVEEGSAPAGPSSLGWRKPYHYALVYARRGWPVFPLFSVDERGCECARADCVADPFKQGKHPRTMNGFKGATIDEDQIREWWRMWPSSNIGIATEPAGLVVIDVDPRHRGEETIDARSVGHLVPRVPTVTTGSGGLHFYFTGNERSRAGALGPGLDVKSIGGYVVAPPSIHGSGHRYLWNVYDAEPAPLPPFLVPPASTTGICPDQRLQGHAASGTRYVEAALEAELAAVRSASEGTRNDTLNTAVLKIARFVRTGQISAVQIVEAFATAARAAGLPDREVEATIESALKGGLR